MTTGVTITLPHYTLYDFYLIKPSDGSEPFVVGKKILEKEMPVSPPSDYVSSHITGFKKHTAHLNYAKTLDAALTLVGPVRTLHLDSQAIAHVRTGVQPDKASKLGSAMTPLAAAIRSKKFE